MRMVLVGGVPGANAPGRPAFGRLLWLSQEDRVTVEITFAVRNVALASAIAITLLNRIEYAAFAVVYFLTEVPPPLGVVAVS